MHLSYPAALRSRLIYHVAGDVTTQSAADLAANLIRAAIDRLGSI